MLYTVLVMNEL